MSLISGDKSRSGRMRKAKLAKRVRHQDLRKMVAVAAVVPAVVAAAKAKKDSKRKPK